METNSCTETLNTSVRPAMRGKWQIKGELREMTLIDAQNEIYQSLLEEGETELAEAWKEVGDMMQGGLSAEEVLYVLQRRQHKAYGKALENINLKE